MVLWTLSRQAVQPAGFIRYWSEAYDYADEDRYTNNIGKPLTKRRLMDLFRWKNGREISERKKESIVRNYLPHIRGAKSEDDVWALTYKGASHGPIWNIFFAHCLMPDTFPIYDQHVHRAMMYLSTGKASELPKGKRAVIDCYRERYLDFFESFVESAPRSLDRALWAFGRFIKTTPWVTWKNVRDTSAETIATFDAGRIERLRRRARSATKVRDRGPEGWTKSTADPMKLFGVFRPLRLKDGFALRAYQYRDGCGNGNGLVFAMPDGSPFPAPEECRPEPPEHPEDYWPLPFPAEAERDMMRPVEGDGEPWSYVLASILARELGEFGALWHGCSWSTHTILGENPLVSGRKGGALPPGEGPSGDAKDWVWAESKPRQWEPTVLKESGHVVVRFYTYSGLGQEAIHKHLDAYEPGCYAFETERAVIAEGQEGYVF